MPTPSLIKISVVIPIQDNRCKKSCCFITKCYLRSIFIFRCPNKFPYLCERSAWSDQSPRPVTTTATTTTTTTTVTTTTKEPVPPCTSLTLPARHTFFTFLYNYSLPLFIVLVTECTQSSDGRFLAYIPSMMEKSAMAGEGGGVHAPPLSAYYVPSHTRMQCMLLLRGQIHAHVQEGFRIRNYFVRIRIRRELANGRSIH